MRHRVPGNQLGRPADQRKAALRSLATELLRHDEIITTVAKAKAVRSEAEKIITKAKRAHVEDYKGLAKQAKAGDADAAKKLARTLHIRRQISSFIYDKEVTTKVIDETAVRYMDRKGGYTRIIRAGFRRGDAAPMAIIQLV
jgi:large subunit ribosomal protein L17